MNVCFNPKGIAGLNWVHKHCSNVDYVVQFDDDVTIDMTFMEDTMLTTLVNKSIFIF